MAKLFLLFGSNIGNRSENISKAIYFVSKDIGEIFNTSSLFETDAWGNTNQDSFYNLVCEVSTNDGPELILTKILEIEQKLGRVRVKKWEARIIDIDILYIDDIIFKSETLQIPHPLLHERKFTLMPLVQIAADYIHPILKLTSIELLQNCKDSLDVKEVC